MGQVPRGPRRPVAVAAKPSWRAFGVGPLRCPNRLQTYLAGGNLRRQVAAIQSSRSLRHQWERARSVTVRGLGRTSIETGEEAERKLFPPGEPGH